MNDFQENSTNPLGIPNIKVVGSDGEERVRPDVIQFVTSLSQLTQMVKMRKMEESKIPSGLKSMQLTITDSLFTLDGIVPNWISFSIYNAGNGDVYMRVNDLEGSIFNEAPIPKFETIRVNLGYPVIHRLYLQSSTGTTATVRIHAEEGHMV